MKKISKETEEVLIQRIKEGKTKPEIVKELNLSVHCIDTYAKRYGLKIKSAVRKVSDYKDVVEKLFKEGKQVKEIANTLGFDSPAVSRYLNKIGLNRTACDKNHNLEIVKVLHSKGLTSQEICSKTTMCLKTVKLYLTELGLEDNGEKKKQFINVLELEPLKNFEETKDIRHFSDKDQKEYIEYSILNKICADQRYISYAEAVAIPGVTPYYLKKFNISIPGLNSRCNIYKTGSVFENQIREYLLSHNIQFEEQKEYSDCTNERNLRFDFYLPGYNTLIECDGKQHYDSSSKWFSEDQIQRDKIKTEWCKSKNIHLIRIPYVRIVKESYIQKYLQNLKTV